MNFCQGLRNSERIESNRKTLIDKNDSNQCLALKRDGMKPLTGALIMIPTHESKGNLEISEQMRKPE
jgi:hypothetical protein